MHIEPILLIQETPSKEIRPLKCWYMCIFVGINVDVLSLNCIVNYLRISNREDIFIYREKEPLVQKRIRQYHRMFTQDVERVPN